MVCSACIMHNTQDSCYVEIAATSSSVHIATCDKVFAKRGGGNEDDDFNFRKPNTKIDAVLLSYLEMLPCLQDCWQAFECYFDDVSSRCNCIIRSLLNEGDDAEPWELTLRQSSSSKYNYEQYNSRKSIASRIIVHLWSSCIDWYFYTFATSTFTAK